MNRLSVVLCGLVLASLPSTSAFADTLTFTFAITSGSTVGISGSGSFTATSIGNDEYSIGSISGSIVDTKTGIAGSDAEIVAIVLPGNYPNKSSNDNLLSFDPTTGAYSLDSNGVSFELGNGTDENLFEVLAGSATNDGIATGPKGKTEQTIALSITPVTSSPVPEPGTLGLMGTGILGLAGVIRRRFAV